MKIIQHSSNNSVLGAPYGWDHRALPCEALPITRTEACGQPVMASYWKPDAAEIATLQAGGTIALWIWGVTHPPVSVVIAAPDKPAN